MCACGDQVPGRAAVSIGGRTQVRGKLITTTKKESSMGSEVGARRRKEGVETVEGVGAVTAPPSGSRAAQGAGRC